MLKTQIKKLSSIVMILLGVLIACSPSATQIPKPTMEINPSATVVSTSTPTVTITPSPIILELDSASELPIPIYKQECANILHPSADNYEKSLQDFSASGTAVFSKFMENSAIILYNLQSGKKTTLPENLELGLWADWPKVSPDRKWLFYMTGRDEIALGEANFVLSDSEGSTVKTIPVSIVSRDYDYKFVHEWLNNNSLRLLSQKDYRDNKLVVLLLNPFTEQISQLTNEFKGLQSPLVKNHGNNPNGSPNLEYLDWGVDPFYGVIIFQLNGANVLYRPDESLAYYPHKDGYAVLYDVNNQKQLARVIVPNWGELPEWSPNGEYLSVISTPPKTTQDGAKKDFYLISSDGKRAQRLTYLSEQFERVSIKEYAWSPDGTKIAFWLNTNFPLAENEIVIYELTILNVTNGNVTNYCIPYLSDEAETLAAYAGLLIEPVWSPDSRYLLVPSRMPTQISGSDNDYDVRTFLFDPTKLSALEIMDSIRVSGWMINE